VFTIDNKGTGNIFLITFVLILLTLVAHLEAPQPLKETTAPTSSEVNNEESESTSERFTLVERFVDSKEVDGYLVETYRQYEVYTDENGKVIKSVPTSNYSYIRYLIN
jgi:hypothetical protein